MRAFVVGLLLVAACRSDRERDCDEIRELSKSLHDKHVYKTLVQTRWRDGDVAAAVAQLKHEHDWTYYTPYSTEPAKQVPTLTELCKLGPR